MEQSPCGNDILAFYIVLFSYSILFKCLWRILVSVLIFLKIFGIVIFGINLFCLSVWIIFFWPVFKLADSFLWYFHCAIKLIKWVLYCWYYIFYIKHFHLIFLNSFCLYWNSLCGQTYCLHSLPPSVIVMLNCLSNTSNISAFPEFFSMDVFFPNYGSHFLISSFVSSFLRSIMCKRTVVNNLCLRKGHTLSPVRPLVWGLSHYQFAFELGLI